MMGTGDELTWLTQSGKKDPYVECPTFETGNFVLRIVTESDAADLLACYADANARPIFNSDTCTSNFFFDTYNEMRDCIKLWLQSYSRKEYIRFSIIDRSSSHVAGTIEMFGRIGKYKNPRGILRLDIASKYEETVYLNELFSLCLEDFFDLFAVDLIVTKAVPEAAKRITVLKKLGFTAYDFPEREHYWCAVR